MGRVVQTVNGGYGKAKVPLYFGQGFTFGLFSDQPFQIAISWMLNSVSVGWFFPSRRGRGNEPGICVACLVKHYEHLNHSAKQDGQIFFKANGFFTDKFP